MGDVLENILTEIRDKYNKYSKTKITKSNRCKYARENETIEESIARNNGFLSGLLIAKHIIEMEKANEKEK